MDSKITTCLWCKNKEAEDIASHYVQIFNSAPTRSSYPPSEVLSTTRYLSAGRDTHGQDPGSVMTVEFSLRGQSFSCLNGGDQGWSFSPAVSLQVVCADQAEVDYFWEKLGEGGDEGKRHCGWVEDRFGFSWHVMPAELKEMLSGGEGANVSRVTVEMMQQKKFDIERLRTAFKGEQGSD